MKLSNIKRKILGNAGNRTRAAGEQLRCSDLWVVEVGGCNLFRWALLLQIFKRSKQKQITHVSSSKSGDLQFCSEIYQTEPLSSLKLSGAHLEDVVTAQNRARGFSGRCQRRIGHSAFGQNLGELSVLSNFDMLVRRNGHIQDYSTLGPQRL